jgi:GNAT superfamily N-acetyltransferase
VKPAFSFRHAYFVPALGQGLGGRIDRREIAAGRTRRRLLIIYGMAVEAREEGLSMEDKFPHIKPLSREYEERIRHIPFLNIDWLLIPSPYERDKGIDVDYEHSFVWDEEGELLGYLLVYSNEEKTRFHLYKQVTSPFGRGKGIGSAFVEKLAGSVDPDAQIYLYVWEKLISSIDFFEGKGFSFEGVTVYRKMKFHLMSARAADLRRSLAVTRGRGSTVVEEVAKVRHDAKKSVKVLFDMASMLSADNFNRVIEDINRETTALLNTLNTYEDKIRARHEVNVKELITDRVLHFVDAASIPCEVHLKLNSRIPPVVGNYVEYSRALINLVSNSLDAIGEAGRNGHIDISLADRGEAVLLAIRDNGVGIEEDRLKRGPDGLPLFVGKTTKRGNTGEGVGTRQIFSTFGEANITVESAAGSFTQWNILLKKSTRRDTSLLTKLESKYLAFIKATARIGITPQSSRTEIGAFIWQLREMEIFSYDLVYQFSRHNNVRDIYRNLLAFRYGGKDLAFLKAEVKQCRIEYERIRSWLLGITSRIKRNEAFIEQHLDFESFKGILFKSYGQAIERTIVFTLDPETGRYLATDRKLAEHADFVQYLGRDRDHLLRGELSGDVNNVSTPIYLGVWSAVSREDLEEKLRLIRRGVRQLLLMGLKGEKKLAFYATTFNTCESEIDTLKVTTLQEFSEATDAELEGYMVSSQDELRGLVFAD